ncbi:MAG: hypothetical protein WB421_17300 [Terriglobales bacterium]
MSDLKSDMVSAMKEMVPITSPETQADMDKYITLINTIPKERMFELVQEVFSKTKKEYVEEFIMTGLSLSDTEKAQLLAVLRNIYLLNERKDQPCDS